MWLQLILADSVLLYANHCCGWDKQKKSYLFLSPDAVFSYFVSFISLWLSVPLASCEQESYRKSLVLPTIISLLLINSLCVERTAVPFFSSFFKLWLMGLLLFHVPHFCTHIGSFVIFFSLLACLTNRPNCTWKGCCVTLSVFTLCRKASTKAN